MPDLFVLKKKPAPKSTEHKVDIGLFSAFWQHPDHQSVIDKEHDETVLLVLRGHFITNLSWILITIILSSFPLAAFLVSSFTDVPFVNLPLNFILIITALYYLAIFGYSFTRFLEWYYNITFLTQKRIIDIDFGSLVFQDVAETQFPHIQDINYTQSGFLRSFFNFGDVFAQTAGERENFEALGVPSPGKVTQFIAGFMKRDKND